MAKKADLKAEINRLEAEVRESEDRDRRLKAENRRLQAEVKQMREHWRPVPITHEWQPRDPQCALCDEPRTASRHLVDS